MVPVSTVSAIVQTSSLSSNFSGDYLEKFIEFSKLPIFQQILNLFNVILIFTTAFVAYLSWRAARRANELQLLPLLAIYFTGKPIHDRKIQIKNIGKSPAYEIRIESFANILTDIQHVWRLDLSLSGTNVLVPDEGKDLTLHSTDNGKEAEMGDFMVFHLDPEEKHQREKVDLLMTFRNAEGHCYYSEVETGLGGLYVLPAKRLNWWGKLYLSLRKLKEVILLLGYKLLWRFTKPYVKQPKR